MILVDRKIAEAVAGQARLYEATDEFRSSRTLPGYEAWATAIQAQYALPLATARDGRNVPDGTPAVSGHR